MIRSNENFTSSAVIGSKPLLQPMSSRSAKVTCVGSAWVISEAASSSHSHDKCFFHVTRLWSWALLMLASTTVNVNAGSRV